MIEKLFKNKNFKCKKMSIRYYKTKNGRMLASLPTGEMIEGLS